MVIIHVIDQRSIRVIDNLAIINSSELEREMMSRATEELQKVENKLESNSFEVKSLLKIGFPVIKIMVAEKDEDVSVIVIGSHGKSNPEEKFLGSVSEKAIRKCEKPVFVIKR